MAEKAGLDVRQCSRGPEKRGYRVQAVDHGLVEMIKFRANVTNMEVFLKIRYCVLGTPYIRSILYGTCRTIAMQALSINLES